MEVREASVKYLPQQESNCPPGYKRTEVGVVPEDWKVKSLADITVKIIDNRGNTPPLSRNSDVELIETASISFVIREPDYSKVSKYVSYETYNTWFRDHPDPDDILVSTVGEYSGSTALFVQDRGTIAQNLIAVRIQNEFPNYIFYWTRSSSFDRQLKQVMMNQAQPSLRVPWLMNFKIPLPPTKAEQEAIAMALSDTDALIESLEQLIAKKRHIKQGAMQELLCPKECWVRKSLGNIFQLTAGKPKSKYLTVGGKYIVMDMGSVSTDGRTIAAKLTNLDEDVLELGDLVMPKDDIGGGLIIGKVAYIDADDSYVLGDHVYRLRKLYEQVNTKFFYYLINSQYINNDLKKKVAGSAQLGLGRASVLEQVACYPEDIELQDEIAETLSDLDVQISVLETQLAKTRQLKQGMMHELLTGRIRLVKASKSKGAR